jgi:transcriptional regulator with XRE-family HTH domain
MKLSDYRAKLVENQEYVAAEKELKARFELGNAVLRGRIKRGWSQSDLAEEVGTKQANISRIEAGLANPTLDLIQRLCEVLDLELKLLEHGQAAVVEMAISGVKSPGGTATGTLERVDNQPENIFCPGFRISSKQGVQEGVLE